MAEIISRLGYTCKREDYIAVFNLFLQPYVLMKNITLFKKETGLTFTNYVNEIRVEKSKRQLLKDNRSILDIALSVGFTNQNYFAITFKKHTEMTPMEFRKKAFG